MSRTGDCWDNSVAESFFATIKAELIDESRFATRATCAAAIGDYIDTFYNPQRQHSYLGYVSPIEFELRKPSSRVRGIVKPSTEAGEFHFDKKIRQRSADVLVMQVSLETNMHVETAAYCCSPSSRG